MKAKVTLTALALVIGFSANAQIINPKETAKRKAEDRTNRKADETIERQSAYIDKDIRHQWQDTRQKHKSVLIKLKSDFEANADKWSDEIAKRTIG